MPATVIFARSAMGLMLVAALSGTAHAGLFDDIGYTQLHNELGALTPTGTGIQVSQIEATEVTGGQQYEPDAANAQFTGKTFTFKSGAGTVSSHATVVGDNFYGNTSSIAPGITNINSYLVDNWIGTGLLNGSSSAAPLPETSKVENHSWAGTAGSASSDAYILAKFDYTISRDDFVATVGVNNGAQNMTNSTLLAQGYNSIAVGLSNGNHAHGGTTVAYDNIGRIKPDIVVPDQSATSFATPVVGAAAAMLLDKATHTPALTDATHHQVVKALLLDGAVKTGLTDPSGNPVTWSHTATQPLDSTYGAGALNVYNSYHILAAGEAHVGASSTVGLEGWDYTTAVTGATGKDYFFDVPVGQTISQFSALLDWDIKITPTGPGGSFSNISFALANLDLKLYSASGFALGALLDSSVSTVDNVEHIYFTNSLSAGRYALQVTSDTGNVNYALAWNATLAPEPATLCMLGAGLFLMLPHRKRRGRK